MRFVIVGAGAVGGVVGARLHQAGFGVTLIARGAHLEAIERGGLRLETPAERVVLKIPVTGSAGAVEWCDDHVALVFTKSQDTLTALLELRAAAPPNVPVVCAQNGVENERVALRLFAEVYGAVVMTPVAHLEPGVVQAYGTSLTGYIDIGRYPSGVDRVCEQVSAALRGSGFGSAARPDIMRLKYAKLLTNLGNAVDALCEPGPESERLIELARAEGRAALGASAIDHAAPEVDDVGARWRRMGVRPIDDRSRPGSSTWQSIARGARAVETDYLNGEVVLLGRMNGVPTPVNELLCRLASRHAAHGMEPGTLASKQVLAELR